uniref:DNA recombination and repair protein Rad51-like C-terminal domain-containing protein n=1 Tax=Peronospora matthiolae TaxID=2874970 RepID=A0AAV1TS09_9STRA
MWIHNDWDVIKQQTRLPALLAEHNTKLVVLDSVAAVFRLESTSSVKVVAASVSLLQQLLLSRHAAVSLLAVVLGG